MLSLQGRSQFEMFGEVPELSVRTYWDLAQSGFIIIGSAILLGHALILELYTQSRLPM